MRELNVKVKPCYRDTCFMSGDAADVEVAIRIDGSLTRKSLTDLIDILTALRPPKKEPVAVQKASEADRDDDGDVPF